MLTGSQIDAVVLDLLLPGGRSGFDVLKDIRAIEKLKRIPVLILTVKDLSERERETLTGQGAIIFEKGSGWRPRVRAELRRIARKGKGVRILVADDNPAGLRTRA